MQGSVPIFILLKFLQRYPSLNGMWFALLKPGLPMRTAFSKGGTD